MRHFCFEQAAFFKVFGLHLGFDFTRDVVPAKMVWEVERTQKIAILKQLRTHFKVKHGKGAGTPLPCVPARICTKCIVVHVIRGFHQPTFRTIDEALLATPV